MSDLKGVPNLHLSGVLTVYCIHPMYIHHLSFNFRLCLGFSHILPVPRYGEAMARAVVAEEHRAWLRSTFVPQPAGAADASANWILNQRYMVSGIS